MTNQAGGTPTQRVTRDVEVSAVGDLLEHPPRATVAFVEGGAVELLPASARFAANAHLFGLQADAAPDLDDREVVLVIDDGRYWFELRGISVRGVAVRAEAPRDGGTGPLLWYTIKPRRVLAWDYSAIREE